jgi:L-lactate dehydrogenase complex protein LldG
MFAAEIGITSCTHAVAETGTLAMCSGPGSERLASLLPPVHIAVVHREQILPDLFDLFARLEADGLQNLSSNVSLITGPSKTGDLELRLTTGVHGPGKWHVILILG